MRTRYSAQRFLSGVIFLFLTLISMTGCENEQNILSQVEEKEANLIVVFLESHGITANKVLASSSGPMNNDANALPKFHITVGESDKIKALSLLNQNGLPKRHGISLLELFAKQGLMSTDKEEEVRYHAGLSQQITNTILMIDGVIDASVQISFPTTDILPGEATKERITAAIYVKHQGIIDDPNIHLENKIKRLVSGSVTGLDINDVTVVSDRARFADIKLKPQVETLSNLPKDSVKIWSIILNKESAARFRTLFFVLCALTLVCFFTMGWVIWKAYPLIKSRGGLKGLINPVPFSRDPSDKKDGDEDENP